MCFLFIKGVTGEKNAACGIQFLILSLLHEALLLFPLVTTRGQKSFDVFNSSVY